MRVSIEESIGVCCDWMGQTLENSSEGEVTEDSYKGSIWEELDKCVDELFKMGNEISTNIISEVEISEDLESELWYNLNGKLTPTKYSKANFLAWLDKIKGLTDDSEMTEILDDLDSIFHGEWYELKLASISVGDKLYMLFKDGSYFKVREVLNNRVKTDEYNSETDKLIRSYDHWASRLQFRRE